MHKKSEAIPLEQINWETFYYFLFLDINTINKKKRPQGMNAKNTLLKFRPNIIPIVINPIASGRKT